MNKINLLSFFLFQKILFNDYHLLTISLKAAIVLPQIVLVAATESRLVGSIGALVDSIAARRSDDAGPVGALEVRLGTVVPLGDARHCRFIGAIRAVLLAVADIVGRDAAAVVALKLRGITFG